MSIPEPYTLQSIRWAELFNTWVFSQPEREFLLCGLAVELAMVKNTVGVVTFCCAIKTFAYVMWLLFQRHHLTQSLLAYPGFSQFLR